MKRVIILLFSCILLTACSNTTSFTNRNTIIDWIDFIKVNGTQYEVINNTIISNPSHIGEKVAEVEFKVGDNVTDLKYQIKNGDATFWEVGTEIFKVLNMTELIAVPDEEEINGFRIYQEESVPRNYQHHFKDLDMTKVTRVELYEGYSKPQILNTMDNKEEITQFLALLSSGETDSDFSPDISQGDSEYYQMVFFSDEQLAYKYDLFYDSKVWYWNPWDTAIVSSEIEKYILP